MVLSAVKSIGKAGLHHYTLPAPVKSAKIFPRALIVVKDDVSVLNDLFDDLLIYGFNCRVEQRAIVPSFNGIANSFGQGVKKDGSFLCTSLRPGFGIL
jgi:hypothetical protein